jgi:puromycin-sensitive aminopeptidase
MPFKNIGFETVNTKNSPWFALASTISILPRYKSGFLLTELTKSVSERFLTAEQADTVETFFREHPMAGSERSVAQAVETVRLNAAWLARDRDAVHKFLIG